MFTSTYAPHGNNLTRNGYYIPWRAIGRAVGTGVTMAMVAERKRGGWKRQNHRWGKIKERIFGPASVYLKSHKDGKVRSGEMVEGEREGRRKMLLAQTNTQWYTLKPIWQRHSLAAGAVISWADTNWQGSCSCRRFQHKHRVWLNRSLVTAPLIT